LEELVLLMEYNGCGDAWVERIVKLDCELEELGLQESRLEAALVVLGTAWLY